MSLNNTPLQGAHINVVSGNFIIAQPLGVDDGVDYCHSGRIRRIDEDAIHRQLDSGAIVLMGPVAVSVTGESFNLTSEEIATQPWPGQEWETASRLLTERKLSLEPLIAHRGSFESFAQAVRDIARNAMPGKVLLIP